MTARGRVYLVDDDPAVRSALGGLLEILEYSVRVYDSGTAFLIDAPTLAPGCVLLDLRMPVTSGLEVQLELARLGLDLPVIFLTAHGDVPTGVAAMKRGAEDFLQKPVQESVLVAALDLAFGRLTAARDRRARVRRARELVEELTPREREVVGMVVSGLRSRQIAARLDISLQTVKVHRMRAMAKLEAGTLPELALIWTDATESAQRTPEVRDE